MIRALPLGATHGTGAFGAVVVGADLAALSQTDFIEIHKAWLAHGVLLFRDQCLGDPALVDFSRRFGPLESYPASEHWEAGGGPSPDVWVISNVVENGRPIGSLGAGEAEWHTDMSHIEMPPMASALYALEVPAAGGDTWFLDMTEAYESLPQDLLGAIEGRSIKHASSLTSVGELRKSAAPPTDAISEPGAVHPIVRTHPETGVKALYLGRRSWAYVVGLPLAESEALLDRLWAHCAQPQFTFAHAWRAGDLILWDNRAVMHRRDAFDGGARRIMHRTQIKGDRPR